MTTFLNEKRNTSIFGSYGLRSQIRPAYSVFNGTDDKLQAQVNNFNSGNSSGYIKVYWNVQTGRNVLFASSDDATNTKYVLFQVFNGQVNFLIYRDTGGLNQIKSVLNTITGWHEFEVISNGSAYTLKMDGANLPFTVTDGADDGAWFNKAVSPTRDNISIGFVDRLSDIAGIGGGAWVEVDGTNKWILTGHGKYIYDVIGTTHLTYSGTGGKTSYDVNASFHLAQDGWSLFTRGGELDEYVPYTAAGSPQSPAILSTYTKVRDNNGNVNYWNLAPAVIDFNPGGMEESKLEIFNKANSTIHIAAGGMLYYNSVSPYAWRIDELVAFATYNGYFNVPYQERLFTKVESNVLKEILNCKEKQTGNDLDKIKLYCGIT